MVRLALKPCSMGRLPLIVDELALGKFVRLYIALEMILWLTNFSPPPVIFHGHRGLVFYVLDYIDMFASLLSY